jgi:hypothetical protein
VNAMKNLWVLVPQSSLVTEQMGRACRTHRVDEKWIKKL